MQANPNGALAMAQIDQIPIPFATSEELVESIREAVVNEHETAPDEIILVRPGALPKTTSGKIQRNLARQLWREGSLAALEPA